MPRGVIQCVTIGRRNIRGPSDRIDVVFGRSDGLLWANIFVRGLGFFKNEIFRGLGGL